MHNIYFECWNQLTLQKPGISMTNSIIIFYSSLVCCYKYQGNITSKCSCYSVRFEISSKMLKKCLSQYYIISLVSHFHFQGIILVYDITNEESFQHVDKWIQNIRTVCLLFIVLNFFHTWMHFISEKTLIWGKSKSDITHYQCGREKIMLVPGAPQFENTRGG